LTASALNSAVNFLRARFCFVSWSMADTVSASHLVSTEADQAQPPVLFDLASLATEAIEAARRQGAPTGVHLEGVEGALVRADRDTMRDALDHLLDNALQRSPPEAAVDVKVWRDDESAYLSVTDRGPPVPPDRLRHMFEPFFLPSAPGSVGYRSVVSLGLHLVKLAAERHGGRVWLESGPVTGTTVSVCLPAAR
jgi:signal transduction histidine kinase